MKSLQLSEPHAIIVIGIQGSGKTFFASQFAKTFEAPYVQESSLSTLARDQKSTTSIVDIMIRELAKTKRSLVLEIDAHSRQIRQDLNKMLKAEGYVPLYVWVQTDADSSYQRAQKQSGITIEQHRKSVTRFTPPKASEPYLVISGKHTYPSQAKIVLKKLAGEKVVERHTRTERPTTRGQIIVR